MIDFRRGVQPHEAVRVWNVDAEPKLKLRTPERIAGFFTGLELVEPGWVSCSRWRPEPLADGSLPAAVDQWCGIVRKR